jgi:4-hydroxy-3-methylbut-2-enyl diphosphate reductase
MKILLANPRGFCAGVDMAIDTVEQTLELLGPPLYVYHEIVHNRHVVDRLRGEGVTFVDEIDEVPEGGTVIFSAHGVSPAVRQRAKERGCRVIDATCPLVTKVHAEAIRYAKQGYHILLVGHRAHDEVVGTSGEAPEHITVVESVEEVEQLPFTQDDPLVYLTQTTLSMDDAQKIITAMKARYPQLKDPPSDDICYATTNRQRVVRELAPSADLTLVVGSKNSSNSVRLTEISENLGTPATRIDDLSELDPALLEGVQTMVLTSGASAPDHLVKDIIAHLKTHHNAQLEEDQLIEEDMHFNLPKQLRVLQNEAS